MGIWKYFSYYNFLSDELNDKIESLNPGTTVPLFDIDQDYYFDFQTETIPSIVRSGLSPTTADVTLVIRFATMLNLAR